MFAVMYDANHLNIQAEGESEALFNLTSEQFLLRAKRLTASWHKLCKKFLPVSDGNSLWRYNRAANADDAEQGWKLHIAATILSAGEVLEKVAPFLISRGVQFKAPESLQLLSKLNSGLTYGYIQVGKFITVYPRNTDEAVSLARRLHKITAGMAAPAVPFDSQYRPDSCVYYRYGGFKFQEIEISDGVSVPAIRDLSGNLVPDQRENAKPDWLNDPFQSLKQSKTSGEKNGESPLKTTYNIFRALKQRGKGGVYQAIDISLMPPRLCIVKEGRRHGEVDWDGRDGFWRVKNEAEVLDAMQDTNINAPRFYSTFELSGNYYLAIEFIEGESLEELLKTRKRRFSVRQIIKYAGQIAELLARIHAAGWVWRDCKPANLIVTKDGSLRPLDFEGACRINESNVPAWRTLEFSAPESKAFSSEPATEAEDIYSFGTVIYYLLTGKIYEADSPASIKRLRRDVPQALEKIIEKLLVLPIQKNRPSAKSLAREFNKLPDVIKQTRSRIF